MILPQPETGKRGMERGRRSEGSKNGRTKSEDKRYAAVASIPRSLIPGRASLVVWNAADRLTAMIWSHLSVGKLSIGSTYCIPVSVCECVGG